LDRCARLHGVVGSRLALDAKRVGLIDLRTPGDVD
jgi:hypothetical protein